MVTPELQARFHIIAPDMRGHGDSDRVGAGGYYYFLDYIADLHSFIEQLGRENVSLVGHSMGGSIASYYAGTFPAKLKNLVLMEGMGPPETDTLAPERVQHWIAGWKRAKARSPHLYSSIADAAEKLLARDPLLDPDLALQLAEWGTKTSGDGVVFKHDPLHLTMGPIGYSVAIAQQYIGQIACPVLLIEGAESRMRHGEEEYARRVAGLSNYRMTELPGAGHILQRHQPEQLAELLLGFVG